MRDITARKIRVRGMYNAGFMVVKPTVASRVVYRMMRANRRAIAREQPRLNQTFEYYFSGRYRESSFLQHTRVPDVVKKSIKYMPLLPHSNHSSAASNIYTVTGNNVSMLYSGLKEYVINCGILKNINFEFRNKAVDEEFQNIARNAFELADYDQHGSGKFV